MKHLYSKSKKCIRLIAVMLTAAAMLSLVAACDLILPEYRQSPSPSETSGTHGSPPGSTTPGSSGGGLPDDTGMELEPGMPPLTGPPAIPIVLTPAAPGEKAESNSKAVIDYSNAADGYVMIKWTGGAVERGLRVQVIGPGGTTYTYTLKTDGEFEVYPLSDGNGSYTIRAVDLLSDGRGSVALSASISVTLVDEFAPFLRPNQYVNFTSQSNVVKKAAELVTAESDFIEKIAAIYGFVISNISYDRDLANEIKAGLHPNYLPVLDSVLEKKKGICFDFASVMAAMLRSQGIPTKLVVGNVSGDLRHAWLSVYSEEDGWIDAVIYFDSGNWKMMDPTFASSGGSSDMQDFIGDGSNYVELYLY